MPTKIHPTAIIESGAKLGADVTVGPYSIIGAKVEIGDRCVIGPHVVIEGITSLAEENEVFQFASIGAKPQDLKYRSEPSTLVIGARNKIREFVTLQPGTAGGGMTTTIGNDNLFMANSHVGHDCRIGSGNIFANSVGLAGHVTVFDRVTLGGLVGVHQFVRLGSYAFLGAGSMVGNDIPPYCIGQGDRCHLRGLNLIGLERAGFTAEEVTLVKKAYRWFFSEPGGLSHKVETLPAELQNQPVIALMLEFFANSSRGICQPTRNGDS